MPLSQALLPEFDMEMANTRKTLERVPDDKFYWKPHPKSGTMGWLAGHLANLPLWAAVTLQQDSLDLAPAGGQPMQLPSPQSQKEVLEVFDRHVADARAAFPPQGGRLSRRDPRPSRRAAARRPGGDGH